MKGNLWLIVIALLVIGGLGWLWLDASKPLPGEQVADLGQEHVTDISGVVYNSNPPTSGKHFPVWAKKGVYDRIISDGHLIHSLEHGYVVVSYDCNSQISSFQFPVSNALAHEGEATGSGEASSSGQPLLHMTTLAGTSSFTSQNPPAVEVPLPESFNSEDCMARVGQLSDLTKVAERVIVVPRLNMDAPIALTAWTRILKMDSFDKSKGENFVKAFHNNGPEKTME